VTTGGTQAYDGQATLGASTTLTGSTVTFLDKVVGAGNGLTVTGDAVFGNAAADTVTGLSTLHVTGSSAINTDTVSSGGTQAYDGQATLGASTTLTGSSGHLPRQGRRRRQRPDRQRRRRLRQRRGRHRDRAVHPARHRQRARSTPTP
jgi:hypothetical protein